MEYLTPKELINMLKEKTELVVEFIKKDGTKRIMKSTLNFNIIPKDKHPKNNQTKNKNDENNENPFIRVFDLEKNEWRGFNYNSIINIKTNTNKLYSIKK